MDSRVGTLDLKVRAASPPAVTIAASVESFTVGVLRRCDEILEHRCPGRIWIVRELDLSLRLIDSALSDPHEMEAFASALVESFERKADALLDRASGDPEFAVFSDEVSWRAAHLEARVRPSDDNAWMFAALNSCDEALSALVDASGGTLLRDVIVTLYRRGTLLATLGTLREDVVASVAHALGMPRSPWPSVTPSPTDRVSDAIASCACKLAPSTSANVAWLTIAAAAHDVLGAAASDDVVVRATAVAFAGWEIAARDQSGAVQFTPTTDGPMLGPATIETAFGGALYLISLALELSAGEILWCACLPEGIVLSRAVTLLLNQSAADDPAPLLCGGVRASTPLPPIALEQQAEIARALTTAFLDAVARRDLVDAPAPVLRLIESAEGPLLVATNASGFVWFVHPAYSARETQTALDAFFDLWPVSWPSPQGERALVAFDRRARIKPVDGAGAVDVLLSAEGPVASCAVVSQMAGALAALFAARVRADGMDPRALSKRYFKIPGRVTMDAGVMTVALPMEYLDLDVRRAGLDVDPGWVPWLHRRVVLTYVEPFDEQCR
jgi:hypothetical protein